MKEGFNESDARRAALVELGGEEQVKELVREARLGHFVATRIQDVRYAFRILRKAPLFSLTVAAVLALGIGSTALMFTIVNSLQLILARTFRLTALGIIVDLIASFFLSRFLRSILFGITAHDTMTFIAVPLCLNAIALLAGYLPARRATRVDPVSSLRYE